jgi:hypothetical protein
MARVERNWRTRMALSVVHCVWVVGSMEEVGW